METQLKLHLLEQPKWVTLNPEVTVITRAKLEKSVLASTASNTYHTLGLGSGKKTTRMLAELTLMTSMLTRSVRSPNETLNVSEGHSSTLHHCRTGMVRAAHKCVWKGTILCPSKRRTLNHGCARERLRSSPGPPTHARDLVPRRPKAPHQHRSAQSHQLACMGFLSVLQNSTVQSLIDNTGMRHNYMKEQEDAYSSPICLEANQF